VALVRVVRGNKLLPNNERAWVWLVCFFALRVATGQQPPSGGRCQTLVGNSLRRWRTSSQALQPQKTNVFALGPKQSRCAKLLCVSASGDIPSTPPHTPHSTPSSSSQSTTQLARQIAGAVPVYGQLATTVLETTEAAAHLVGAVTDLVHVHQRTAALQEENHALSRRLHEAQAQALAAHMAPHDADPHATRLAGLGVAAAGAPVGFAGHPVAFGTAGAPFTPADARAATGFVPDEPTVAALADGMTAPAPEGMEGHPTAFSREGAPYTPLNPGHAAAYVPGPPRDPFDAVGELDASLEPRSS